MNAFIKVFVSAVCMLFAGVHVAAQNDTIYLSSEQAESLFIRQNLQLLAERLNIEKADAAIIQAGLWPNPTLTIDQINLWSTNAQRQGIDEVIPPLSDSFGKNLNFALGIDQIILMAGKRGKLIDMEKVSKEMAAQYFEELLCGLKAELRSACAELLYNQEYSKVLEKQRAQLTTLITNYKGQVQRGNISQSQLLRLQAALLEVESEANEVQKEMNILRKNMKILLNTSTPAIIYLVNKEETFQNPENLSLSRLSDLAVNMRPDLKRTILQTGYFKKSIRYERAQRIPDITLHAAYDRGGNCMLNFVGLGISVDLPFFNRNQGAIKTAEIAHKQSIIETEQKQASIYNEVALAFENYRTAYGFNARINNEYISDIEDILDHYTRNFVNKNIGIVEYLDFFDTYKNNKRTILTAQKDLKISFEELQLAVGKEISEELLIKN